jgi:uncharacterized RDD family membrane protein YckC
MTSSVSEKTMGSASPPTTIPANILWRILQGVLDDSLILIMTFLMAWWLGALPSAGDLEGFAPDEGVPVNALLRYWRMTAHVGAVLVIYAAIKFVYYTGFVAWDGRTPACRLFRLRIVMADGTPAGLGPAIKRALAGGIISHTPLIGWALRTADYLATFFNPRKQAGRDLAARTMLVRVALQKGGSLAAECQWNNGVGVEAIASESLAAGRGNDPTGLHS